MSSMKKRKHVAGAHHNRSATAKRGAKNRSVALEFDNVDSDDSADEARHVAAAAAADAAAANAEPAETAEEKKVRLAKEFIERLAQAQAEERENDSGADDDFFDGGIIGGEKDDAINKQLLDDALERAGKTRIEMADKLWQGLLVPHCRSYRAHRLPVTCVAISDDGRVGFSGSKDCTIIRWDLDAGTRTSKLPGRRSTKGNPLDARACDFNTDQVLALALSDNGEFLASGGLDRVLRIWDPATGKFMDKFRGHLGAVNGLAFQRGGTGNLFSGSSDRTIKVWNIKDMAYVETLYGHQEPVYAVDSHRKERCVSVGHDETARLWKIPEELQLILRERRGVSLDCVAMLSEQFFVSGSNEGTLSLWDIGKKKPIFSVRNAHPGEDDDADSGNDNDNDVDSDDDDDDNNRSEAGGAGGSGGGGARAGKATVAAAAAAAAVAVGDPAWRERPPRQASEPNWISAVAAVRTGDVVASGSCDGFVRLWRCALSTTAADGSPQRRGLTLLCAVEVPGFVNGLQFSKAGDRLMAGVGQEHRLGRWWRDTASRNSVWVIDFKPSQEDDGDEEDSEGSEQEGEEEAEGSGSNGGGDDDDDDDDDDGDDDGDDEDDDDDDSN